MTIPINTLLQGNQSQNPYIGTSSGQSLPILLGPKRFESLYNRPRSKRGFGGIIIIMILLLIIITPPPPHHHHLVWLEKNFIGQKQIPSFCNTTSETNRDKNPFVQNKSTRNIRNCQLDLEVGPHFETQLKSPQNPPKLPLGANRVTCREVVRWYAIEVLESHVTA